MSKKGMKYDYKKAHDKNLPMSERFHYLENARHDQDAGSPATFADPTMASVGVDTQEVIQPQMTFQPPTPSNQMGTAKPVFNPQTQGMAQTIYGTPEQRQMSMPQPPMFMSAKQEKAFGPGSKVYEGGNTAIYEGLKAEDVSPLDLHKPGHVEPRGPRNSVGAVMIGKEIPKKNVKNIN